MAKKKKSSDKTADGSKPLVKNAAARAGFGALLIGVLLFVTRDFWRDSGLDWVKSLTIAIGLALVIRWTLAEPFRIPSGSMQTTLHGDPKIFKGDRVFVNKLVYGLRWPLNKCRIPIIGKRIYYADTRIWRRADPQRWDIVVFKSAEKDAKHTTLVKRLVGLPGERIHIADGKVYADGVPLELPPGMPPIEYTNSFGMTYGVLPEDEYSVVPEDCYLVLGDNSGNSRDGRYFGWLPNENILGRVSCIWWPYPRWRDFTGFSQTWWWRGLIASISILLFVRVFLGRSCGMAVTDAKGRVKVDHVYINRWAFGAPIPFTRFRLFKGRDPRRGELVLYRHPNPGKKDPEILLGRVAGLSGERVFLKDNQLEINGAQLEEPATLVDREFPAAQDTGPYGRSKGKEHSQVPEDHFFIMVESAIPEDHLDSRTVGWIHHKHLIGTATAAWWPPMRWRRIH